MHGDKPKDLIVYFDFKILMTDIANFFNIIRFN